LGAVGWDASIVAGELCQRTQRFVLPQLITAAQDMWHSGSSTWFDRTASTSVFAKVDVTFGRGYRRRRRQGRHARLLVETLSAL
jgi:hypothetical protein